MVKPLSAPLDTMRAYRACLNCRNRKSKCDLDLNHGKPPCRRCQRENKDCVLGESHRGGRRIRKKPRLSDIKHTCPSSPGIQSGLAAYHSNSTNSSPHYSPLSLHSENFNHHDNQEESIYPWSHIPLLTSQPEIMSSRRIDGINLTTSDHQYYARKESTISLAPIKVHEGIASADLDNPSDALEILAQVADRADDEISHGLTPIEKKDSQEVIPEKISSGLDNSLSYCPLQENLISVNTIYSLFSNYEDLYHPYFPIVPRETFDAARLPWMSRNEPHLFSAILTIASRDNDVVHQICYDHMQKLISMILSGTDANIEAIEGLLLLSQWVSRPPQAKSSLVGRGEEDRVAWMYIGTALRLACYIGLDHTSFRCEGNEDPMSYRKQLVWAACYICDRQVSIRVGKGFWTRGPDLPCGLKSTNFPTLRQISSEDDDYALIFQANLEMIQIFSSVHNILYSSKDHGWKEMLEGRYAEYLDDFQVSIRNWNDNWGSLKCSPRIKASLLLTYNYLRLYVNAFAYQATISRVLAFKKDPNSDGKSLLDCSAPLINATAPDARFIYEALDAAKSLISTFNGIDEPTTLRYMPSTCYLFIIYSAVFLYKARITTTMTDEERQNIRTMIQNTIERLQKTSTGSNHIGSRYARLLQLLWRKVPRRNLGNDICSSAVNSSNLHETVTFDSEGATNAGEFSLYPSHQDQKLNNFHPNFNNLDNGLPISGCSSYPSSDFAPNGFSWLDLGATCNFATQNNSGNISSTESICDISDETILRTPGLSPWSINNGFFGGWKIGEGEGGGLIF